MTVRTRIAPSPTGELHIGTLRTILYDYAYAKKHNGKLVVRIEDTDRNRMVEGSQERLLQTIKDYGLSWDEGPEIGGPHEPYIQSERLQIYRKYAEELIEKGHAYYCFCTPERLQSLREEQQAQGMAKTGYDKHCRNLSEDEVKQNLENKLPYVIRIKIPENETVVLNDLIHGKIEFNTNEVDDMVLLKSDDYPTYHLAAMVDDHLMEISHVFRGVEWMPSSPIHILLYKFFGWDVPEIAHLPNLKEKGMNQKLSKRFGSVEAAGFLKSGYLPKAILNHLMFIGWNPGTEKEIYSLEEFINDFSLEKISTADLVVFDREKLLWMNGTYIREMSADQLMETVKEWAQKYEYPLISSENEGFNLQVVKLVQERLKTLEEFNDLVKYFYDKPQINKELLVKQTGESNRTKEIMEGFRKLYENLEEKDWETGNLDRISHEFIQENSYKPKEAFMTLRVAVTGETATPPIFDVLCLIGKEETIARINQAF